MSDRNKTHSFVSLTKEDIRKTGDLLRFKCGGDICIYSYYLLTRRTVKHCEISVT